MSRQERVPREWNASYLPGPQPREATANRSRLRRAAQPITRPVRCDRDGSRAHVRQIRPGCTLWHPPFSTMQSPISASSGATRPLAISAWERRAHPQADAPVRGVFAVGAGRGVPTATCILGVFGRVRPTWPAIVNPRGAATRASESDCVATPPRRMRGVVNARICSPASEGFGASGGSLAFTPRTRPCPYPTSVSQSLSEPPPVGTRGHNAVRDRLQAKLSGCAGLAGPTKLTGRSRSRRGSSLRLTSC